MSSPSVFRDVVYNTLQHALLACLLWYTGGADGALHYTFYPNGRRSFPTLTVPAGSTLGIPTATPEDATDVPRCPRPVRDGVTGIHT